MVAGLKYFYGIRSKFFVKKYSSKPSHLDTLPTISFLRIIHNFLLSTHNKFNKKNLPHFFSIPLTAIPPIVLLFYYEVVNAHLIIINFPYIIFIFLFSIISHCPECNWLGNKYEKDEFFSRAKNEWKITTSPHVTGIKRIPEKKICLLVKPIEVNLSDSEEVFFT